jgi:Endoglucanase
MKKKLIRTEGKKFIDAQGRHTLLHGINMVCKEKEKNYIGDYREEDFENLKRWGFNVIRLGIFWDGIEPQPGCYDDRYLTEVDRIIEMAGRHGLYVFLDMHQDLFGSEYSDGAPAWATLTDGAEHVGTELWSEAYLLSGAVQKAFDNFWSNKRADDGIGIQDHYIRMWSHIAARYKDKETIIGYDIMNEPFIGTGANDVWAALFKAMGEVLHQDQVSDMEELMAAWMEPSQKMELIDLLSDKLLYKKLVQSAQELPQRFEKTCLKNLYEKTARAIRKEDENTMLFLEANYFSNAGMRSGICPVTDEKGIRDKNQVFTPHGYDILVDTEMYNQSCDDRIDVIFETHREVADELNMPMLVSEWGCYPNATQEQLPQAAYLVNIFEKYLASDTYFDFSHIYNNLITKVLIRAYPMQAAGEILRYHYDYKEETFTCEIKEDGNSGCSILYLPNLDCAEKIKLEPYGDGYKMEKIDCSKSGYLLIPVMGKEVVRVIRF